MNQKTRAKTGNLETNSELRVRATARHALDDEVRVDMFLHRKQRGLGGKRPINMAQTEEGARKVETLLWATLADKRL